MPDYSYLGGGWGGAGETHRQSHTWDLIDPDPQGRQYVVNENGSAVCYAKAVTPGESGLVSRGSQGLRSPLESRRGSLGAP